MIPNILNPELTQTVKPGPLDRLRDLKLRASEAAKISDSVADQKVVQPVVTERNDSSIDILQTIPTHQIDSVVSLVDIKEAVTIIPNTLSFEPPNPLPQVIETPKPGFTNTQDLPSSFVAPSPKPRVEAPLLATNIFSQPPSSFDIAPRAEQVRSNELLSPVTPIAPQPQVKVNAPTLPTPLNEIMPVEIATVVKNKPPELKSSGSVVANAHSLEKFLISELPASTGQR